MYHLRMNYKICLINIFVYNFDLDEDLNFKRVCLLKKKN